MRQPRWVLVALIAVLVTPLAVAMAVLRLRNICTANTPLSGLAGRIGRFPDQGSHPGPLSFYALWPTWKLVGSSPWGMQVGVLVLNAVAVGASVLVAFRRGG